jgi:exodeoxyribonuclease VII small subunit
MNQTEESPQAGSTPDESTPDESTPSFEDAMQELEEIVETLEDGQAPLGDSLKLVQRGRELSEMCAQMLSDAELTLSQLAATPEGELVEEELEWNEE